MPDPAPRVFLSHSSADKPFARELYRRLTRDGVSCFFDTESIGWGDNWVRALERALDECEFVVFVLSPDFCNSEWVEVERTSAIADNAKRKVRPLMLRPCRDLPTFPRFLRQVQALDVSSGELFEQNYPLICQELGGVPRPDDATAERTKLPPVHPLPARHRMPFHSLGDRFAGRVDYFWKLYDSLYGGSTAVVQGAGILVGTGGLGKSQLAIEYAHRFGVVYTGGVYWVDADRGLSTLITQVSTAAEIELNTKAPEDQQVSELWKQLNRLPGPSLLILDNFPENEPLRPYLPPTGRIHTLVTTRRQDLDYPCIRLGILSAAEGLELLNSGARQFGGDAAVLVERLGGLPLALELTKSFLNLRKDLTIASLIEEFNAGGELDLLNEFAAEYRDQLPSGHEKDIAATFRLSWDLASSPAQQILRVMAELAPVGVPQVLLRKILGLPGPSGIRDPFAKSITELVRLSLVELDTNQDPVAHRLVLAFVRQRNLAESASPFDQCAAALRDEMNRADLNVGASTMRELELLVPHVEFVLADQRLSLENHAYLANRLGTHYQAMGRYQEAKHWLASALDSDERSYEPGHPSIARSQSYLGLVLRDLGQLEAARDLLRKALASDERSHEPGNPSIARSQSNLATVLRDLGQLEEAHDLLRKALASNERTYTPGHPYVARGKSNLALVLQDLGQLEEACDLLRQALASNERVYEPGHRSIATLQSNLALVLKNLGQLEEARDLMEKALASDERSYEAGHPSIAISQSNLATVLKNLGQLEEARELLQKAHSSLLSRFGPDHPNTRTAKHNLDSLGSGASA